MKNEMRSQYILYGNPQRGEPFRKNTVQKGALSYIYMRVLDNLSKSHKNIG